MTEKMIRVMIADDQEAIREALVGILSAQPGIEIVGLAADAEEAVSLATREKPDVALLDVRMPKGGGQKAAAGIRVVSRETRIIALSAHEDTSNIVDMFERGAGTYIVKGAPNSEVVEAVRRSAGQHTGAGQSDS